MNWPNALSVVKKSAVASKENKQSTATAKTTHSISYSYYWFTTVLRRDGFVVAGAELRLG